MKVLKSIEKNGLRLNLVENKGAYSCVQYDLYGNQLFGMPIRDITEALEAFDGAKEKHFQGG